MLFINFNITHRNNMVTTKSDTYKCMCDMKTGYAIAFFGTFSNIPMDHWLQFANLKMAPSKKKCFTHYKWHVFVHSCVSLPGQNGFELIFIGTARHSQNPRSHTVATALRSCFTWKNGKSPRVIEAFSMAKPSRRWV